MWVLTLLGGGKAEEQQATIYLTSGDISIGRPLKKGSTVGKADILIFNEQSVSTIHAKLLVEAAVQQGLDLEHGVYKDFEHGVLSITDISRFGTHLTRSGTEQRLPSNTAVPLKDGDVLRFGSQCSYLVQQQSCVVVSPKSCQQQHPDLQQQASSLNIRFCSSWQSAQQQGALAAADQTYCVVRPAELLNPTVLYALVTGRVLVTPAWVEAASQRKVWFEQLPAVEEHLPQIVKLPPQQQGQLQVGGSKAAQSHVVLSEWRAPEQQMLAGFTFVFESGCQDDLVLAATALGATAAPPDPADPDQSNADPDTDHAVMPLSVMRVLAAARGTEAKIMFVQRSAWLFDSIMQQQRSPSGVGVLTAGISEVQLLLGIVHSSMDALYEAAHAAFMAKCMPHMAGRKQRHQQQQQPRRSPRKHKGAVPAAQQDVSGDETEADMTEEGDELSNPGHGTDRGVNKRSPVVAAAAAGGGSGGGGGAAAANPKYKTGAGIHAGTLARVAASVTATSAAAEQGNQGGGLLPSLTPGSRVKPAVSTAGLTQADGWHAHGPSQFTGAGTQRTQGRVTGSKRGAAAAAAAAEDAGDAGANSRGKRRKTAAATSPTKSALPLERKARGQPSQKPGPAKKARNADPFALDIAYDGLNGTAGAGQQQEEDQEQQEGPGGSIEITVQLIAHVHVQRPQMVAVGGGPEIPNFKAFRRKGQGQAQQQQQQQAVPRLELVSLEAPRLQGADIDAFLRDERQRQDRMRKADELFNASVRATKAPPMAKPAAARGRKR